MSIEQEPGALARFTSARDALFAAQEQARIAYDDATYTQAVADYWAAMDIVEAMRARPLADVMKEGE